MTVRLRSLSHLPVLSAALGIAILTGCHEDDDDGRPSNGGMGAVDMGMPEDMGFLEDLGFPEDMGSSAEQAYRVVAYVQNPPAGFSCGDIEAGSDFTEAMGIDDGFDGENFTSLFDLSVFDNFPARLQNYCVFDFSTAETPNSDNRTVADGSIGDYDVALDQAIVLPQAPPAEFPLDEAQLRFRFEAGAIDPAFTAQGRVGVVVVDSYPDEFEAGWTAAATTRLSDDHGYAVARIIESLTCGPQPNDPCFADVLSAQALRARIPQTFNGTEYSMLGGAQSELARAILRALAAGADQNYDRLVLNLSLGWAPLPGFGGTSRFVEAQPPELTTTAAVYDAVRFAACEGAVIVAAAGNDFGRDGASMSTNRPLFPAGWNQWQDDNCDLLAPNLAANAPFILSAGGVTTGGNPLQSSRPADVDVAAIGTVGVASQRRGSIANATALLNGSSVATAVVSAAAAGIIALGPQGIAVPTETVFGLLEGLPAMNGPTFGRSQVPIVRVCEAVQRACTVGGGCMTTPTCLGSGGAPPRPDVVGQRTAADENVTVSDLSAANSCPPQVLVYTPDAAPSCVGSLPLDETPTINPQPGCDTCEWCMALVENQLADLQLSVNSTFGWEIGWLEVGYASGGIEYIDLAQILAGASISNPPSGTVEVYDIPLASADAVQGMRIIWNSALTEGKTTISELPVYGGNLGPT